MSLDDDLDPEPVCVRGIDKEVAVDRANELGLYGKARDYILYRFVLRKAGALLAAEAGLFMFAGESFAFRFGIITFIGSVVSECLTERENRNIAAWLEHRQAIITKRGAGYGA